MFQGQLDIDLPSAPYPRSGWVKSMMHWVLVGPDPHVGREHLVVDALVVLDGILQAMGQSGFDDVIRVRVDHEPVYVDARDRRADLHEALEQIVARGALHEGLKHVQLGLSRRAAGLHTLADVSLDREVPTGERELCVRLSARISSLRIDASEGPRQYRDRVLAAVDAGVFDEAYAEARAATERLAGAIGSALPFAEIEVQPTVARLVIPGRVQLGRLRHLGFRQRLRPPTYRADPTDHRVGAYDDPHVYYCFDPYYDLLAWILVEAIAEGRWRPEGVQVVDPTGKPVTPRVDDLRGLVELGADRITVAASIPDVGLDVAESGSPHTPGWGGEDLGE